MNLDLFIRGEWKNVYKWDDESCKMALILRCMSKNVYKYIYEQRFLPLPSESTLTRRFLHFQIPEGYLWNVSEMLKIKALDLSPLDRIVVLSFDEVSTKRDISYDSTTDSIIGPHSKVNVMLSRGLFHNFKIPIWYRYYRKDEVFGPDEFKEIVTNIQNQGYHVMAAVCDNHRANQKLARLLGITEENPFFKNPSKPGNIYWFYDPCHILKLIRSHLIDDGFKLPGLIQSNTLGFFCKTPVLLTVGV